MGRAVRLDRTGGLYHLRGRVARSEALFEDPVEARAWVDTARAVAVRDGLALLAWCLLPDRYHLALRTARTPLARSMRQLHGSFAQASNRRRGLSGPLWRGRYDAVLVEASEHAADLVAWVHLRPVTAGLVATPARWSWSGHAELAGGGGPGLVDVGAARQALGAAGPGGYLERVDLAAGAEWVRRGVPELPWWTATTAGRAQPVSGAPPRASARGLVEHVCATLDVDRGRLAGRTRERRITRCREMLATLALERLGIRAADLAAEVGLHPDWVCHLASRGSRRRAEEPGYSDLLDELERGLWTRGDGIPGPAEAPLDDTDWAVWM
jgi:hypothetical protein